MINLEFYAEYIFVAVLIIGAIIGNIPCCLDTVRDENVDSDMPTSRVMLPAARGNLATAIRQITTDFLEPLKCFK